MATDWQGINTSNRHMEEYLVDALGNVMQTKTGDGLTPMWAVGNHPRQNRYEPGQGRVIAMLKVPSPNGGNFQQDMRNRYYDPASGQFTQPDPIGLAGGLNSYGFAAGDPVTYSDPYGLEAEEIAEQCRGRLGCLIRGARGVSSALRTWRATRRARGAVDDLVDDARRSGRGTARVELPARPNDMSANDFGARVMRWGTGNSAARDRIGFVTREELQEAGVTHQMAREWRDFYVNEVLRNPRNPSARGRAELMHHAMEVLR